MQWAGFLIYLSVVALWAVLFSRSVWLDNIWAWSAGIVYILYDTVLMLIVVWQTLPLRKPQIAEKPLQGFKRPWHLVMSSLGSQALTTGFSIRRSE